MKTYFSPTVIILVVTALLLSSCFGDIKPAAMSSIEETHTLVAIDLSDRIHHPQTLENDILVIKELFAQFQQQCRETMFVDCTSSFSIVLIQQRGDQKLRPLVDSLTIDLGQIDPLKKREAVENFAATLERRLQTLYSQARKPSLKDYDGACIFRFLNSLPSRLDVHQGGKTQLYFISDGLIEVDSPQARIAMNGRQNYITETQMSKLRKDNAWQQSDLHLLVVPDHLANRDNNNLAVILVGLQGRSDYALELDLLTAIWKNWTQEMNISDWV